MLAAFAKGVARPPKNVVVGVGVGKYVLVGVGGGLGAQRYPGPVRAMSAQMCVHAHVSAQAHAPAYEHVFAYVDDHADDYVFSEKSRLWSAAI